MLPNLCSRYCHQPRRPLFALSRASQIVLPCARSALHPRSPLARADSARWIDTMGDSEACRWWRGGLSSPAPGPVGRVACGASRWRAQQRFRRSRLGLLEYWRGRALAAPRGVLCVRAKCTKGVVGEVWIMAIDTPYTRVVIDWTDAVGSWDCSSQARKPREVARKR